MNAMFLCGWKWMGWDVRHLGRIKTRRTVFTNSLSSRHQIKLNAKIENQEKNAS